MKDIKDYRERELPLFVIANVLVFLIVHDLISININDIPGATKILSELFSSVIFSAVSYGFILTIECLFTSELKEKLVYLWGVFSLPGYTIFSDIKKKNRDNRFSYKKLAEKHPEIYEGLPSDKKIRKGYENENWYAIYAKHREAQMIRISQRDLLLCRDVYISVLAMIGMYIVTCISQLVSFNFPYVLFLFLMAVITNIGANRKAVRFAYNVIAYDLYEPQKKEK